MHRIPVSQETLGRRGFLAGSAAGAALFCEMAVSGEGVPQPLERQDSQRGFSMTDQQRKDRLLECLGGAWPDPCPLNPQLHETTLSDGYRMESLTYQAEPDDPIPAILLIPEDVDAQHPAPAVAVWHQHNGQWHLGKSEPAGLAGDPMHHTGVALVREGYVVLCPDALCFEQRQHETLRGGNFERFEFLRYVVAGKCMAWKNILDMRRAIDYLCSRPEVRADRIGCYGHSMGSTHTWLVGPWEPRLKCLVGNCCLPTYEAIHRTQLLHCFPNFVPGWFQYGDTPDIAALIAPRALHLNFGENDGGSPIQEVRAGIERIARAYADAGADERFSHYIEPGAGHVLSEEMWRRTRDCFARHLIGD
jgi:dienelactone hydrolase